MMQLTFISDVLMQSMLMLRSASAVNIRAPRPGVEAMREPTMAILATSVSISTRPAVLLFFQPGISVFTASMSSLSMMNVIRLRSCAGAAWMISRTLISASARSRKTWAAMPG